MGVHGIWDLLAPIGRRVSVETVAGKRLAIDASIWMIQFMKAMRDEKGEMVKNAHILGFFRRICKLLYLRTKPVFVFDGGTPALKRRTVIARRRQRENAQAKIRKTAEKLLLNHLKAMRLKELATALDDQKSKNQDKGKKVMLDQDKNSDKNDSAPVNLNQEMIDEMLAASLAAEEGGGFMNCSATHADMSGSFDGSASTSAAAISLEDEDEGEEDDEEMILPMTSENVDPSVLAALPPSMQLDLLVQMRERLMAENRQKYQKVKKAPQKFSELQIEAYLKTVAFRREIDGVQKAAAGKGVGGVQTSRIASEANREFIFSSSFAGDKQALTSGGPVKNSEAQGRADSEHALQDCQSNVTSAVPSNPETSSSVSIFGDDVQTYIDDRGRMRVSKVRALGVRMTRDLQRNLDLMNELELDRMTMSDASMARAIHNDAVSGASGNSCNENRIVETSYECNADSEPCNISSSVSEVVDHKDHCSRKNETALEISFENGEVPLDDDDEMFAHLVGQNSLTNSDDHYNLSGNHVVDSASDFEWEDGIVGDEIGGSINANKSTEKLAQVVSNNKDEFEVEWEEGDAGIHNYAAPPPSKGSLEEAAALDEAIRKSLLDVKGGLSNDASDKMVRSEEDDDPSCKVPISQQMGDLLRNIASNNSSNGKSVQESAGSPVIQSTSVLASSSDDAGVLLNDNLKHICSVDNEYLSADASEIQRSHEEKTEENLVEPVKIYEEPHKSLIDDSYECPDSANTVCTDVPGMVLANLVGHSDAGASRSNLEAFQKGDFNMLCGATQLGESVIEKPVSHTDLKGQIGSEEVLDRIQEREHDMKSPIVRYDEDSNLEVLGAGLEDELLILGQENVNLGDEQRKLERNADSVNSEMFVECQELLQMFGIPYIIAPMEAEAQCAYMELMNLVDGVVTDDSDVLLFGARSVYKNIFDDRKYVETYFMKDIENELGLDRGKLIRMALLLGSDYTEGVSGIGVVNAIEVVNAFPEEDGLLKFREWVESPDPSILGNLGAQSRSSSKKKGPGTGSFLDSSNTGAKESCEHSASQGSKEVQDKAGINNTKQIFMDKHRNVSKNWHMPSSFPSDAVISAYASPQVDKSTEPFSWGKPDHLALRKLCWEKFGWGGQKSDELLLPVLKEYNKHETQLRLEAFYSFNERFAKIRSKRIKQAVKGITANQSVESVADKDTAKASPQVSKKQRLGSTLNSNKRRKSLTQTNDGDVGDTSEKAEKAKKTREKNAQKEIEKGNVGVPTEAEEERSHDLARGRGGRGRGRGRRVPRPGRGRRITNPASEFSDASTSHTERSNDEQEVQNLKEPHNVRRSMRPKKAAKYAESDLEIDEDHKQPDKETVERKSSSYQTIGGDASADTNVVRPHTDDSHGEGLALGGGFCIDEKEATGAGQLGLIQSDGDHVDADRDYLNMGGGFCTEDADMDHGMPDYAGNEARGTVEADEIQNVTMQTKNTSPARTPHSLQNLDDQQISSRNPFEAERSARENVKDDYQSTMNALSAMPLLRRKKRRNQ